MSLKEKCGFTNRFLISGEFEDMPVSDRKRKWKWARSSEQVKKVRKLETDFLNTVHVSKKLSLLKKEEIKKKKAQRSIKILEECKKHGGPITPNTLNTLNGLVETQLLHEIAYLRATIAPNIRQMRRVNDTAGKFRMEKFGLEELRTSIRNAVKPEEDRTADIDALLMQTLTV